MYKLNTAQKEAVEYTTGPLLIVAGAGTGKTTVIARKIQYLIENFLAKPEEILALTFTDKAAEEMQSRVDGQMQVGYVDLSISTFHSFCQRVLEKYAIDVGLSNQFKLLSDNAAWILLKENLNKFNLNYYRPLGNQTRHAHELIKHFSKCKDELISPQEYLQYAKEVALDKDTVHENKKSRLTELANAYHVYNQMLLDGALLDFGDLIYYTVKLFAENSQILKKFQERYKYILVDEFQDVNWAQYRLINLFAKGSAQLTVVGDDDQSIYAFRGASVSNILRFKDDFKNAKEVILKENYRSNQQILDTAYELIQNNNPDRLEVKLKIDKKLIAHNTLHVAPNKNFNKNETVKHIHEGTLQDEVKAVVNEITRLKKKDKNTVWDDFAILVRANSHADSFIEGLESAGIPYEFLSSRGLFKQPVVLDCLNYLKLLDDYHESSAVYRLLILPFFNFSENDLQKITYNARKKSISYYVALKKSDEFKLSPEGAKIARELLELIHQGMQKSRAEKPSAILYNFLEKSGYLSYLTKEEQAGNREKIKQIYHLKQFFDYLVEFEDINYSNKVSDFIAHFKSVLESGDSGKLIQPSDTPDSVNILTIHGAKGLEFKNVFVVNLVEDRLPSRARGQAIEIPEELIKEQLPEGDAHYQEERRLFYVAMTRAKERLYLTSATDYGGARQKKLSRFLVELGYKVPESKKTIVAKIISEKNTTEPHGEFIFDLPKAYSFSQLKSYQTCPYQYKLAHVLKIPGKGKASFSFGQTMHNTLQKFYGRIQELNSIKQATLFSGPKKVKNSKEIKIPKIEELLEIYKHAWIQDWYSSTEQREEYFRQGKDILKKFYNSQGDNWTIPAGLESWFKIKVGNYFINGRIDRIDQLADSTLEIIDYKTGKGKEKLSSEDKEQLLVYQIAVQELTEYRNIGKPSKLTFYYLNDDIKTSFFGKDNELSRLKEKLSLTIDNIHSRNFKATPGKFICANCDFKDICEFRI